MPRFLTLSDVAEVLNISMSQTYALVHSQALKAIKVGGRGQWRVEDSELESYIARCYTETEAYLENPRSGYAGERDPEAMSPEGGADVAPEARSRASDAEQADG